MKHYKLNNYLLLGLFSLLLLLPGIAKLPVIDRDEAHFAQASRQMLQTGNYFQIRFQDNTRFRKPPGINWLQAASVKLFSDADANTIWPYRLPSLLAALLSVLLIYFFSCRFVGHHIALLAAALLASSLLLVIESHMAVTDASLLLSVVLMQGALWIIYQAGMDNKPVHWRWALCFWLAMTFGFVLKGVTPLIGFLSIIALCLVERRIDWLRGLHSACGLGLFISLSLVWVLLVNTAEDANYLLRMVHTDLLPKLTSGHESHGKPPLFHLALLPLTFWPASLFLWPAGVYAVQRWQEPKIKFLLAWIFPTWIFFELMPTKLPHYVLPTFPAIALLCALAISAAYPIRKPGKWLHLLQSLWAVLSLGLAVTLLGLPYVIMQQWTITAWILFSSIVLFSLIAVYFAWCGRYYAVSVVILLIALVSYPLIFTRLLPQLSPLWLTANLTELIDKKAISIHKPLLVVGFDEPSVVFNLNTYLVQFVNSTLAEKILEIDPTRVVVIEPAAFAKWTANNRNLTVLASTSGYNYSKGHWVELLLVGQSNRGVSDVIL